MSFNMNNSENEIVLPENNLLETELAAPAGCVGCGKWGTEKRPTGCEVYLLPERQHTRIMGCAMRTHNKVIQFEDIFKLNPLKASKRSFAKK